MKKACLNRLILAALFIGLLISGCVYTHVERIVDVELPKKRDISNILLVEGDLNRKYNSIAFIKIIGSLVTKRAQIDERLKKEAAKAGGDAVIFVTYSKEAGHYPMVTGVIVVYE